MAGCLGDELSSHRVAVSPLEFASLDGRQDRRKENAVTSEIPRANRFSELQGISAGPRMADVALNHRNRNERGDLIETGEPCTSRERSIFPSTAKWLDLNGVAMRPALVDVWVM